MAVQHKVFLIAIYFYTGLETMAAGWNIFKLSSPQQWNPNIIRVSRRDIIGHKGFRVELQNIS